MTNSKNFFKGMKENLKKSLAIPSITLAIVAAACADSHDNPGNSFCPSSAAPKIHVFTRGNVWSAVAFNGVTLAEIHTSISDLQLLSDPPTGYSLHLESMPHEDEIGNHIYRIVCDMTAITQTISSYENMEVEIPYTLTGSYVSEEKTMIKEYKNSIAFQRFAALDERAENKLFSYFWYLSAYEVSSNVDWVGFASENSYTEEKPASYSYAVEASPIRKEWNYLVLTGTNPDGSQYNLYQLTTNWTCSLSLPGWVESKGIPLESNLVDTRFSFEGYPADYGCSVFLVTDEVMWCMKGVYSDSGELLQVYRYKFNRYEPVVPEKPES